MKGTADRGSSRFLSPGEPDLQSIIDRAVRDVLAGLRTQVDGFAAAVVAAKRNVSGTPTNVTQEAKERKGHAQLDPQLAE